MNYKPKVLIILCKCKLGCWKCFVYGCSHKTGRDTVQFTSLYSTEARSKGEVNIAYAHIE